MRPALDVLRSAIEPMLTEHGTIQRTQGTTIDEDGMVVPNLVTVFTGPVLVRPEGTAEVVVVGGATFPRRALEITLPAEADAQIDDTLTLTDCPFDPTLVDLPIRITDVRHDAWSVARFCTGEIVGTA